MNRRRFSKWVGVSLLISCLLAVFMVVPATSPVLGDGMTVTRTLPATVAPGELFQVTIGFTTQNDEFDGVLDDSAPDTPGEWQVSASASWSNPEPSNVSASDNDFGAIWLESFNAGRTFTVVYKVRVPDNVTPGTYNFTGGQLSYYDNSSGSQQFGNIPDDTVEVVKPGEVWVDDDWEGSDPGQTVGTHVFGYDAFSTIQDGIYGVGSSTVNVLPGTYGAFNITGWDGLTISAEPGAVVNATAPFSGSGWDIDVMGLISNSTNIRIDGLEFDGSSLSNTRAEYGIFSLNSTADFTDLYIYDVLGGKSSVGVGIGIVGRARTADISDCEIDYCEIGIKVKNDTANISDCTITGMNGCSTISIGIQAESGAVVNAEGCDISKCVTSPSAPAPGGVIWGMGVKAEIGATVVLDCCNKIYDNDCGIWVETGVFEEAPQSGGGYLIANDNSIYDNSYYGLYNSNLADGEPETPQFIWVGHVVDAEENWWGDASGPGGAGDGSGDNVTAGVDFIPWLDAPCDEHPETVGPNAEFWGTPTTGLEPLCVDFTDESEPYDEWDIVEWAWDFGDGATSTEQNPTHCYPVAGTYAVSLEITDEQELSDTETKVAYVVVRAPAAELPAALPGSAEFAASYLLVSPQQVFPNQEVEVSINIANHGEKTGSHSVVLYINGVVENSETVGVSPGGTRLVVFKVKRAMPGQYLVSAEGQEGHFTVISDSVEPSASSIASGGGLGTAGIIVIVVVVIVLVLGLYFGVMRRE